MKFQLSNPLKWQIVTQGFGLNYADFYTKLGLKGHNGIDLRADRGTEVYAAHDGIVKWAGDYSGYGINILLETIEQFEGVTYQTIYGHLLETKVKKDQLVKSGDLIGLTNNTGKYTTADHLHFGLYALDKDGLRIYHSNGFGGSINPTPFFADRGWDLLPVQKRYNRFYDPSDTKRRPWHAYLSEKKNLVLLTAYLRTLPTNEQLLAVVYGAWPREWIANDAFFPIYATLTYAEYKAGKKPPIRVTA